MDQSGDAIDFRSNKTAPYVLSSGLIIPTALEIDDFNEVTSTQEVFYSAEIDKENGLPLSSPNQVNDLPRIVDLINSGATSPSTQVILRNQPLTIVVIVENKSSGTNSIFTLSYVKSEEADTPTDKAIITSENNQ